MPDSFDIDFRALPPELQIKLWLLALDADTSKVQLKFQPGQFKLGLGYEYGGGGELSLSRWGATATAGANPSGDLNLGLTFRGFNFNARGNVANGSVGGGVGYGAALLPMPDTMNQSFGAAAGALASMAGDVGAAGNNPLAYYKMHSNDISTISSAVALGKQIAGAKSGKESFGAGMRINYAPTTGFMIYIGAQYAF